MSKKKPKWPIAGKESELVPLYGGVIHVATSHAQYNKALRFMNGEPEVKLPSAGCAQMLTNNRTGGAVYLIGLFDRTGNTLSHECAHTAFNILERAKVPIPDGKNNEAFCYLLGWMFERFEHLVK